MRRHHVLRVQGARLYDLVGLRDDDVCCGSHVRVEVTRRLVVGQVAQNIRPVRPDQSHVRPWRLLEEVELAVDLAHLSALGKICADARLGVQPTQPRTTRADGLGQCPLRHEGGLELTATMTLHHVGVAREVGPDRSPYLALEQEPSQPLARLSDVVADRRQTRGVLRREQRLDKGQRRPYESESPHHHRASRPHERGSLFHGDDLALYPSARQAVRACHLYHPGRPPFTPLLPVILSAHDKYVQYSLLTD